MWWYSIDFPKSFPDHSMAPFYGILTGLEITFPKFPIMVFGSNDFPCFFQVGNPAFPPIISNFLPIIDR